MSRSHDSTTEPAVDDFELLPEERKYLRQSARCETCGHLDALHDHEWDCCNIPGCRCQGVVMGEPTGRKGLLMGVEHVPQPGQANFFQLTFSPSPIELVIATQLPRGRGGR